MIKAIMGGFAFIVLILGLAGGSILYMMKQNSDVVEDSRRSQYEQCTSNGEHYNCDSYLIGKGTFRPGDMTDSEHEGLKKAQARGISSAEYKKDLEQEDLREIARKEEAYRKWKEGQ